MGDPGPLVPMRDVTSNSTALLDMPVLRVRELEVPSLIVNRYQPPGEGLQCEIDLHRVICNVQILRVESNMAPAAIKEFRGKTLGEVQPDNSRIPF